MKNQDIFLIDILDSLEKIEFYAEKGKDSFFQSSLIQDGIIRNLEIIGEATNRLDPSFHSLYPEIDWRGLISLRNILIHQYHRVDLNLIWSFVLKDIPELKEKIQVIHDKQRSSMH
ncbi:HepT-like ribonuclease domain-containing protein [Methanospirillum lacunae]|uniref:DUF86 domain-containing protein n=1 Tax=Methanospirillum lacunae TaxID=668570 RepID=A0A2V2NEC7_9EURY|nr:DUF86 domain-containing protein [Methanospirillum lacunae]